MSDVTNDQLLAQVNNPISRAKRWVRIGAVVAALLAAIVVGAILNGLLGGWWAQRKLDRVNMDALVLVIQYNLQQGKLALPPQLTANAPAPAAAPSPSPAPAAPKPAEAPPKK